MIKRVYEDYIQVMLTRGSVLSIGLFQLINSRQKPSTKNRFVQNRFFSNLLFRFELDFGVTYKMKVVDLCVVYVW